MATHTTFFDLAIIGAGSAAAMFLNTLDRSDYHKILCIGEADSWLTRGLNKFQPNDPVNFLNQTKQVTAHFGDKVPAFGRKEDLVKRTDWAASNAAIIKRCTTTGPIEAKVIYVGEATLPEMFQWGEPPRNHRGFQIQTAGNGYYWAKKVVVATGAGPHTVPDEVKQLKPQHPHLIKDMDEFGRMAGKLNTLGKTVVVMGPNAAIDSVETAKFQGFKVEWLIKESNKTPVTKPAILDTPHQEFARSQTHKVYKENSLKAWVTDNKVVLQFINLAGKQEMVKGDMFVYGIGQQDKDGAVRFIDASIRNQLEPIYDVNQYFGPAHQSVLGFELAGTDRARGLQLIGAVATQLADKVQHNYMSKLTAELVNTTKLVLEVVDMFVPADSCLRKTAEQLAAMPLEDVDLQCVKFQITIANEIPWMIHHANALAALVVNYVTATAYFKNKSKVTLAEMDAVKDFLTPSIVAAAQLGGISAKLTSMNGFVPEYSKNEANFSRDLQQPLRVFIATNYPYIGDRDARAFIQRVISGRQKTADGWGYTPAHTSLLLASLNAMNIMSKLRVQATH